MLEEKSLNLKLKKGVKLEEYSLDEFKIILNQPLDNFKSYIQEYSSELFNNLVFFQKKENLTKFVRIIKDNELEDQEKNILNNLLQLEPFTLPVIELFINSNFLKESDFIYRIDKVREITSNMFQTLQTQKLQIRKDENVNTKIEKKLEEVIRELAKHEDKLNSLKKKQEKEKRIIQVKAEIQQIETELKISNLAELKDKLKQYKSKKYEIDKISIEIEQSKKLFQNLPKDES